MIRDEYTDEDINDAYWNKPISLSDGIKLGTVNRSSRHKRVSIYDFEERETRLK